MDKFLTKTNIQKVTDTSERLIRPSLYSAHSLYSNDGHGHQQGNSRNTKEWFLIREGKLTEQRSKDRV